MVAIRTGFVNETAQNARKKPKGQEKVQHAVTITSAAHHLVGGPTGRRLDDPIVRAVTEGRLADGYSSCADLPHALRYLAGLRNRVNRREAGGHAYGTRTMAWLCETGRARRELGHPCAVVPRTSSRFEGGDTLILDVGHPRRTHACVVLEQRSGTLVTADYGQHPMDNQRPEHIACRVVERPLTVRDGRLWAGDRPIDSWLPLEAELAWARAQGTLREPIELDEWLRRHASARNPASIGGGKEEVHDTEPAPPPSAPPPATFVPSLNSELVAGLDVSDLQAPADLDYAGVKRVGFTCLGAPLSDGQDPDVRGAEHVRAARRAGLVVGAYHFFIPWRDPRTQLEAFTRAAKAADYGHPGDLLPWLDIESWRGASGAMRQAEPGWNDVAEPLAELIAERFGGCCVYLNYSDWTALGRPDWIRRHPLVAPHYGVPAGSPLTAAGLPWAIHQHTVAPLPGVYAGPVDQSIARLPLPTIGQPAPAVSPPQPVTVATVGKVVPFFDRDLHRSLRDAMIQRQHDEGRFDE